MFIGRKHPGRRRRDTQRSNTLQRAAPGQPTPLQALESIANGQRVADIAQTVKALGNRFDILPGSLVRLVGGHPVSPGALRIAIHLLVGQTRIPLGRLSKRAVLFPPQTHIKASSACTSNSTHSYMARAIYFFTLRSDTARRLAISLYVSPSSRDIRNAAATFSGICRSIASTS